MKWKYMKRMINPVILTIVTLILTTAYPAFAGQRTTVFIRTERGRKVENVPKDAQLTGDILNNTESGQSMDFGIIGGPDICEFSPKDKNRLKIRQAKNLALSKLREFYLKTMQSPEGAAETNDLAGTFNTIFKRINAEASAERYVIVLFSSGQHCDKNLDFRTGFPSDSFATKSKDDSPFSLVDEVQNNVDVLFVVQPEDFSKGAKHRSKLERWWRIFLESRGAAFLGFVDDKTAKILIADASKLRRQAPPKPENPDGPLIFYRVAADQSIYKVEASASLVVESTGATELVQEDNSIEDPPVLLVSSTAAVELAQVDNSIEFTPVMKIPSLTVGLDPKTLSGSIMDISVESQRCIIWMSVSNKAGLAVSARPENFMLTEQIGDETRQIPAEDVRIEENAAPLAVMLLRDCSDSLSDDRRTLDFAVSTFIARLGPEDIAAVANFS